MQIKNDLQDFLFLFLTHKTLLFLVTHIFYFCRDNETVPNLEAKRNIYFYSGFFLIR